MKNTEPVFDDNSHELMSPLSPNEENPVRLWAEIHKLRAEIQGPQGYRTWKDAAIAERHRRIQGEQGRGVQCPNCGYS